MTTSRAPRAVLFDLDGTLLDSLTDIATSMNDVLVAVGFDPHPLDDYRTMVGDGARALVTRALPLHARARVDEVLALFQPVYRANLAKASRPYDGVLEALASLASQGARLGVVTNKPHEAAVEAVRAFFGGVPFGVVVGQREGVPRKPHPATPLFAAEALGVEPHHAWFVGDTSIDMLAASAAGMVPVGVTWGFRPREELEASGAAVLLDHPRELSSLLSLSLPSLPLAARAVGEDAAG